MKPRCPTCGHLFERQEGFGVGGMAINIVVTEGIFLVYLVIVFAATLPDAPVGWILAGGLAINAVVPIVFYPFSKTLWAAIDLAMQPSESAHASRLSAGAVSPRRRR
jgi:hypothetical protein